MSEKLILVVGAGFAGAVYARTLAEKGYAVDVIDRRHHVAGNAFDEVTSDGTRVHRYGPHLFHTNNADVMRWLERFGAFETYTHRVLAKLPGPHYVPLPVNRTTINEVFSQRLQTEQEVSAFLTGLAIPCQSPQNAAEYLYSKIGSVLTDTFFRPYTRKMWALELEEMHESVVRRIPLRLDDDNRYFPNDKYQVLPVQGYTAIVGAILDHPRITISLNTAFSKAMESSYSFCFNSMPIDEYYDYCYGPLPYRSIRFHHRAEPVSYGHGAPVVNFTDDGPYTRETDWASLPYHQAGSMSRKTVTLEEPCDYKDNDMERYYPVKTNDDRFKSVYERYAMLSKPDRRSQFIGRCGTYQYLDMDQVINQSLLGIRRWLSESANQ